MTAQGALQAGRDAARALMVDTCQVVRPGEQVTDRRSGAVYATEGETVYEGACKVQSFQPFEANPEAGAHTYTVQRYYLHLPVGAYTPQVGDVATITGSVMDPRLVGRTLRVVALLHKSLATAYRLAVTDEAA